MDQLYFKGNDYSLIVGERTFSVCSSDEEFFELNVRSAVHKADQRDEDFEYMQRAVEENSDERLCVTWTTGSAPTPCAGVHKPAWDKKVYRLEAQADGFLYTVRVSGAGEPASVEYFVDTTVTPGGSKYEAACYLKPIAGHNYDPYHPTGILDSATIDLGYLVPTMYCYPFGMEEVPGWIGLGVAARPGEYNFTEFHYKNANNRCWLSIPYYGHTQVSGEWEAPGILGVGGGDSLDVLRRYSAWHYDHDYTRRRQPASEDPAWWSGPFVCGWGEQCVVGEQTGSNVYNLANQKFYEELSGKIDEKNLHPTALIIDDKWQKYYGEALPDPEKWPDLRAFVEREHAKGRKVVLWFKTWSGEGLDADECVDLYCHPYCADPTSPKYQARMRETIRILLSDEEGCYNCDGFKIDFANCMPFGRTAHAAESSVYGVELLHRMFELIHSSAKAVKKDALINCSCAHPYFAEFTDQARLHDYVSGMRSQRSTMRFRRDMYIAAIPEASIDTDGAGIGSRRAMMDYIRYAPTLGVPDLYQITSNADARLTEEDWDEIRAIWDAYAKSLNR